MRKLRSTCRGSQLPRPDKAATILAMAAFAVLIRPTDAAQANVISDWDTKAVAFAAPGSTGEREVAMVHIAMFDAVNSIEQRYRPYLVQLSVPKTTSQEAAAAAAAGTVLAGLPARRASAEMKAALANYLASIPDGAAKADGIKLGEAVAAKVLEARANDGANAPDAYRPKTTAGVYVPTPITVGSAWPTMTPFALTKPSQFRPPPPIPLASPEWAADYNELKDYGGNTSAKRSAQQTETARFWLIVGAPAYHPIPRQLLIAKQMSIIDSARFMALFAVALTDSYVAVFDAKYHYEFWRPITAIRNGDIDDNPATEREATWQPIDNTPLHPEYPCAHCINSGAAVAVIESMLGATDIPEVSMTSSTAPGVVHRWTNLGVFADEVANARIWAGFHYRFSTRVGTDIGRRIGEYVVKSVMQPTTATGAR
jgi:PAP2 superfamily